MRVKTIFLMISITVLLIGCTGERQRIILPPEAPMSDIRKIAVVGFDNYTSDPSAGPLIETFIQQQLDESEQYEIVDIVFAQAALFELEIDKTQLAIPSVAHRFGNWLEVDAVITGEVLYYFENVSMGVPTCHRCNAQTNSGAWSTLQSTEVIFEMRARLIRTDDGAIIWSKTARKHEATRRTRVIPHYAHTMPPYYVIPQIDKTDVPLARQRAAGAVAADFTADLLPRTIWVRVDQ